MKTRLFERLVSRLKAWQHRRYWNTERQLHWLKTTIAEDHRWMAHDPVAKALTERYSKMLAEEWEKVSIEGVRELRWRIGLRPNGGA